MKAKGNRRILRGYALAGLCLLSWCACNPLEEGCLDIAAENFKFDAGRHTPDLCRYPDLILNVFYQWADSSLQIGHLYTNAAGIDYAIHSVQILLSDFVIADAEDMTHRTENMVQIVTGDCTSGTPLNVPDDFVFVDRSAFNYVIGPLRAYGPMTRFQVKTGVSEMYTPMCTASLPTNHRLRNVRAGYDALKGEFALGRFVITRYSVSAVQDTLFGYVSPRILAFDVMRSFRLGRRDTLYLSIDFHHIFDPADLNQDKVSLGDDLASRIPAAISIR